MLNIRINVVLGIFNIWFEAVSGADFNFAVRDVDTNTASDVTQRNNQALAVAHKITLWIYSNQASMLSLF